MLYVGWCRLAGRNMHTIVFFWRSIGKFHPSIKKAKATLVGSWLMLIHVFVSTEESSVHRIFTLGIRIFPIPEDGARAVGG